MIALYIHIPFCRSKCRYCDFNSFAGLEALVPAYVAALQRELRIWGELAPGPLETVYFGGGTPSLLSPHQLHSLMDTMLSSSEGFRLAPGAEVTLEANPATVDVGTLERYRELGVNRLSIGVQSFDDADLEGLGRIHTSGDAEAAFAAARCAGFENVSCDLIYGLPNQELESWQKTLNHALRLSPEHLSLYPLTLEPDTPLGKAVATGVVPAQDPDLTAAMYELAEDVLAGAGYAHYELSNWSLPGRECRHNIAYWRSTPYLGVGAGAHSYFGGFRFANEPRPDAYIKRTELDGPACPGPVAELPNSAVLREACRRGAPILHADSIDLGTGSADAIILGLRLTDGVDTKEFTLRYGVDLEVVYSWELTELQEARLLEWDRGRLRLTRRGRLLANEVFLRFLAPTPAG